MSCQESAGENDRGDRGQEELFFSRIDRRALIISSNYSPNKSDRIIYKPGDLPSISLRVYWENRESFRERFQFPRCPENESREIQAC